MSKSYKTPGVYIEETANMPPTVVQTDTAIPVFIGYTERGGANGSPLSRSVINGTSVTKPLRIASLAEYELYFGTGLPEKVSVSITETYAAGAVPVLKKRVVQAAVANPSAHTMYYHMQLFFANGGNVCYIVSVGNTKAVSISSARLIAGLKMASRYDEPTLIVIPQVATIAETADACKVYNEALAEAGRLKDRFVILDCPGNKAESLRNATLTAENLKYGAAYHPFLCSAVRYMYDLTKLLVQWKTDTNNDGDFTDAGERNNTAFLYKNLPAQLQSLVKQELDKLYVTLPPCSAVAGLYVQTDVTRGVWKAPANSSLNMVTGLTSQITDGEQENLNVDAVTGRSINAIRAFTGKGILVWGARTLAGNDNEWRYISVRRFFNMVEESCKKATEVFVFEPNDAVVWVKIKGMIENFLVTLWRQGALQGIKPEQAFYVSVGLNKTMTALDILEGRLIVEIGLAAIKPAEFIILRFSHKMAAS